MTKFEAEKRRNYWHICIMDSFLYFMVSHVVLKTNIEYIKNHGFGTVFDCTPTTFIAVVKLLLNARLF